MYLMILVLSTQLGNGVCTQFESDGVTCLTKLRSNVFTTFAIDNIDHNPNSCSAEYFWHGTAIFSTQFLESKTDGTKTVLSV